MSKKQTNDALRQEFFTKVVEYFKSIDEDVLRVGTATLAIPCVDGDGDDSFVEIVVKVPTGSKDEAYDGYALAEDYTIKAEAKAAKEKEAAAKKAAKIARDEAKRKQLAESKAKHNA